MFKKYFIVFCLCFFLISCETLFERIGRSDSSAQTSANNASNQSGTSTASAQPARNDPNRRADPDSANCNIAALDTAARANYLTAIEKDVVLEMNKVRTNPRKYAELYIKPMLKYFNQKRYSVPGQITIVTNEGASAVNICITALN